MPLLYDSFQIWMIGSHSSHKLNKGGGKKNLQQLVVPMVATSWYGYFGSTYFTFLVPFYIACKGSRTGAKHRPFVSRPEAEIV